MFWTYRYKVLKVVMLLAALTIGAGSALAKEKNENTGIRLRVEIASIPGDGIGGSIDAFGSDQLVTNVEDGGGGGGAGKVEFDPIVITKDVDSASPKLLLVAATGQHLSTVKINWLRKDSHGVDQVYLSVVLTDVKITSSHSRLGDQRDPEELQGAAVEEIAFDFVKIQMNFFKPDGTVVTMTLDSKVGTSV